MNQKWYAMECAKNYFANIFPLNWRLYWSRIVVLWERVSCFIEARTQLVYRAITGNVKVYRRRIHQWSQFAAHDADQFSCTILGRMKSKSFNNSHRNFLCCMSRMNKSSQPITHHHQRTHSWALHWRFLWQMVHRELSFGAKIYHKDLCVTMNAFALDIRPLYSNFFSHFSRRVKEKRWNKMCYNNNDNK